MFIFILVSCFLGLFYCLLSLFSLEYLPFSCQESLLTYVFAFVYELVFCVDVYIHDFEAVFYEVEFYFVIKRSVCGETGSVVDFKQDGLSFVV